MLLHAFPGTIRLLNPLVGVEEHLSPVARGLSLAHPNLLVHIQHAWCHTCSYLSPSFATSRPVSTRIRHAKLFTGSEQLSSQKRFSISVVPFSLA